jgi:hypothetical protein
MWVELGEKHRLGKNTVLRKVFGPMRKSQEAIKGKGEVDLVLFF